MRKLNTRIADVKPSQLKKKDRIHTAAGMFEIKKIEDLDHLNKNYTGLTLKPIFSSGKKKAYLAVHKTERLSIIRPHKK